MKKLISIALFGAGEKYAQYLPAFVRAHLNLFPIKEGWRLRIHYDNLVQNNFYGALISRLVSAHLVEAEFMGEAPLTLAMLWRMAPVFGDDARYVFCRDLDACPMPRDRAVCETFMASDCVVHTVHDNVAHAGIMGGLCGFDAPAFREVTGFKTLEAFTAAAQNTDAQWAQHGMDQVALNTLLTCAGGPRLLEHRFGGWTEGQATGKVRAAGRYPCGGKSGPTPDTGESSLSDELRVQADRLANHLGSAGYDHQAARKFWDEHGDPDIARRIAVCEKEAAA